MQVEPQYVIPQHLLDRHKGLYASVVGLLLRLEPRHFHSVGEIRVKCRGTIAAEFWEDDVENVFGKDSGPGGGSGIGANGVPLTHIFDHQGDDSGMERYAINLAQPFNTAIGDQLEKDKVGATVVGRWVANDKGFDVGYFQWKLH